MNINSILKKEGIKIIKPLDVITVNLISKNVANKLCLAFPEHGLNKMDLFIEFSRLKMFLAQMPDVQSGAKYLYKDNSIYFSDKLDYESLSEVAVHECIHYLQTTTDNNTNLTRLGLCSDPLGKATGNGINEASVQLMSAIANSSPVDTVKYYNISLSTITPTYYTLECSLLNQIAYFTGTYPLFHSTLNSNDIFKNTFIAKSDLKTYNQIEAKFDHLLELECELSFVIHELQYSDGNLNNIRRLNKEIECGKKLISETFFEVQNLIIDIFFTDEFNNIKNLEDIAKFKERIYNFKNLIGYTETYTFYNKFYCDMMVSLEKKMNFIKENGSIDLIGSLKPELSLVPAVKTSISFFKKLLLKLGFLKREE